MCTSRSTFAHTVTPAGVPVPVRKGPVIIIIIISFLCGVFAFGFPKLYAVVTLSIHNCQFRNRDVICDLCGARFTGKKHALKKNEWRFTVSITYIVPGVAQRKHPTYSHSAHKPGSWLSQ